MNIKKITPLKDQKNFSKREWVHFINSLSGLKSANIIGTVGKDGIQNAAIISSVFHLGANPPLMGFVLRPHSPDSPRHTYMNIKETKHFTINHINKDIYKKAHQTSARYAKNISEFKATDLSVEETNFPAPYLKDSRLKIGLKYMDSYDVKENNTKIIIGEILEVFVPSEHLSKDGYIDVEALGSLCVSGLDSYHESKRLSRLSYAKTNLKVEEIETMKV